MINGRNELSNLLKDIENVKSIYNANLGRESEIKRQLSEKTNLLNSIKSKQDETLTRKVILEESSKDARENGRQLLSEVCSSAVQSVFNGDVKVEIDMGNKSGEAVADVSITTNYKDKIVNDVDPTEEDGGGLADILAVAFFMTLAQLNGENNTAPFLFDEPSRNVSKGEYSKKFSEFLREMVSYIGKQTILATHDDFLLNIGDCSYKLTLDNDTGVSLVERLR